MVPSNGRLLGGGGGSNAVTVQLQRQQVLTAHKLNPHWTSKTIYNKLHGPGFTFSERTIRRIISSGTTTVQTHGPPLKVTPAIRQRILRLLRGTDDLNKDTTRKDRHSVKQVVYILRRPPHPIILSDVTIRRVAKSAGLKWRLRRRGPQLTAANRDQREEFYDNHHNRTLLRSQELVFTDSVPLSSNHTTNSHNDGLWVFDDDAVPPLPRLRRDASCLHCYGALTRHGLLGPFFITGSINQHTYTANILTPMLAAIRKLFKQEPFLFQQDGAPAHKAISTQSFLTRSGVQFIGKDFWPGNPDLSPIENIWSLLKEDVCPLGTYGLSHHELKRRATAFFRRFSVADCRKYLNTMRDRMDYLQRIGYWSIPY